MSSMLRNMQRRNMRAKWPHIARRLRNQTRGRWLGVTNDKAPKPLSGSGHGSRRGTNKRPFSMAHERLTAVTFAPNAPASTRRERLLGHQFKMARKGYREMPA